MKKMSSPALTATPHALHGESDVPIVAPALGDPRFACVLALAPEVDPVISALGALAGGLPDAIPSAGRDSPALSAAVASLIGTDTGERILPGWAEVTPAGWGAPHATALTNAVHDDRCTPWVAAALIGPCDASAALLHASWDIVCAVRRWGQTTPDDPTAWMNALTLAERDRLLDTLRNNPNAAGRCLPWLPVKCAVTISQHLAPNALFPAFASYTTASLVARSSHADILLALMQRAERHDLDALTRMAVATGMDAAWTAVVQILSMNPWSAVHVVTATPWNALRPNVQTVILSAAGHNDVCAAIAFARGDHTDAPAHGTILDPSKIASETVRAFFAAITPTVWDALPKEKQRAWLSRLSDTNAHLAVRSLGPNPAFLAGGMLDADMIASVRRHVRDDGALRQALLPVAVRDLPAAAIPAVIAALPAPPDPVAFIQIAGGAREIPPALRDWIAANPNVKAAAAGATVLRVAGRWNNDSVGVRCVALAHALEGWSAAETHALLAALPDDARAALHPDRSALANALTSPDRRDAFRQALDALGVLPTATTLPAFLALKTLATTPDHDQRRLAGEGLAQALRDHGRTFAAIVGTLHNDVRRSILPSSHDPHVETTLRHLAADTPLVAHHLAYALDDNDPVAARTALATAQPHKAQHLWRLLPETLQHAVLGNRNALVSAAAAPGCADALAQTLQAWNADDPLLLLALRMLFEDDAKRRVWGVTLLAQQPEAAAAILPLLHADLYTMLASHPVIASAGADLPHDRRSPSVPVQRRRH